jgi:PAS domain S-box-containing protein
MVSQRRPSPDSGPRQMSSSPADGDNIFQLQWEDAGRVFSRGWRDDGEGSRIAVLIVGLAAEPPTPAELDRLAHEYGLKDELGSAWAARPLELVRERGRSLLVLEDPGGEPLDWLLGQPMTIESFLPLAIGIGTALAQVHQRGLIHKDIKPANALVNSVTGQVWLTGFGIASRLPRERQAPAPPEVIAGTLAYMPPEQTGRMNRSIDSRSDLYALGVTLYEMLTGELPFTATDPMEWVHCHIARQPIPPNERVAGIPGPLSAIVIKLLSKTAEDRYQTAAGLTIDLRKCLAEWEAHRRIEPFPLGASDASDRLMAPEKLYGREHEIETLLGAFDRVVANGATELVLVSGYAGIGKSSVVNELQKALVAPRGLFASGKFDQYKRDIPYATLAQAFRSLARPLLGEGEVELSRWRDSLSEALGPNGQLIVSLIPELELILGTQPPAADLPPQDAKNRFQMIFRRFLGVFARKEHPLALFLDDLQWLDAATLDLLEHLATHPEVRHLLLVGAYRDNEVGPTHPLMRTLEATRDAGARVEEIVLTPLGLDDVGRLVTDAVHCQPERARPLARLVHEKTSGNPFFAIQFLAALNEDGLLAFDPVAPGWRWDIDRIRARSYTDNVADLMVEKMRRLSVPAQEAMKKLACLGNGADIAALTWVHEETEAAVHAALWEAVYAGLVQRQESAYTFLHDRIQQAAYSLIPDKQRAELHLRIGRALLASMAGDQLAEHLFDVANQLNQGATRLIDRDEKAQVATIDLRAGRRAKAAAAYASACVYLSAGMALLDEQDWDSHYELMFHLRLERAECEFLTSNFVQAEQLIAELLQRGASKIDQAAVYHLNVQLHVLRSEDPRAVDSALTCLRLFGIDFPAHPTSEHVQAEYEAARCSLAGRPIECLIDLPLMSDPELQAAMCLLSAALDAAYHTDFNLFCLLPCRMVNISLQHGISGAAAQAFGWLGTVLGPKFNRHSDGYRLAKLACDLVEKHAFVAYKTASYLAMQRIALWTQPIATAIDFNRAAFRTATEGGTLSWACYCMNNTVVTLLLRNDPLDAVWRESEKTLDFVRKAGFRDMADAIESQHRFIATMQGRTATFSTFSDAQFDEAAFEARLAGDRMPMLVCFYSILKLKARFLSGDYAEALAAADKAKVLLWSAATQIQLLDYFLYTALTVAVLYENASANEQQKWRELLTVHREQLREWAENYPPTFADKHALVAAEIARLEGRDADAMHLFEQAIRSAHDHGFVQNEGLGYEAAARFYAARGVESIANAYLRNARNCYDRWGALGKVRQLDERYSHLQEEIAPTSRAATIGAPVGQLDVETVVKASQAVSGEIVLENLIKTLMVMAVEHAGAERGILILPRGDQLWVEAEATTGLRSVEVNLRQALVAPSELPDSILQYVIRTQEPAISDDASKEKLFSADKYVSSKRVRSVLCLPLIKQTKLVGVLYLENNVAASVFTPGRISLLKLLASQAAISLDNARLYGELMMSEERWRQLFESVPVGVNMVGLHRRYVAVNPAFQKMTGYSEAELCSLTPVDITHEDDRADSEAIIAAQMAGQPYVQHREKRYRRKDGGIVWAEVDAFLAPVAGSAPLLAGVAVDITERKHAEEALRAAQADLERMARLTTMGELTASIAHEINQPLAAIVTQSDAALRWLNRDEPDLDEARDALSRIARDGVRAAEVIRGLRALAKKSGPQLTRLDIDDVIREVLALAGGELRRHDVVLHTELAAGDRPVMGDRVQLQQVLLNLIMNGLEAMRGVTERARELTISSTVAEPDSALIAVEDTGAGLDPAVAQHMFEPFFTTKSDGLGMGLSICRSIVEGHGGRLWMSPRAPHGADVRFTVPFWLEQ